MPIVTINGQPVTPKHNTQLVSRSAILILSSILLGTALGHGTLDGIYLCDFCAGIVGLISFYALDRAAYRRARQEAERSIRRIQLRLSSRIDRHVGQPFRERSARRQSTPSRLWLTRAWN